MEGEFAKLDNSNELIAEFMKLDKHPNNSRAYWVEDQDCYLTFDNLQFHHSWNQLMLVVRKISKLHDSSFEYDVDKIRNGIWPKDKEYMDVIALPLSTPISEVYGAIVEFIKWHNEQPKQA